MIPSNYIEQFTSTQFQQLILNKHILDFYDNIFNDLSHTKKFLLAFYIYGYDREDKLKPIYFVCGKMIKEYFKSVQDISKDISNGSVNMLLFAKYLTILDKYNEQNKLCLIDLLVDQYNEIQQLLILSPDILNTVQPSINNIIRRLSLFHINIDDIIDGRSSNVNRNKSLSSFEFCGDPIMVELKRAYWDYIKTAPITECVQHFCHEFIKIYSQLSHTENNNTFLADHLDADLINQMITNGIYKFDNFYTLVNIVVDHIKLLDSDHGCTHLDQWFNDFKVICEFTDNIVDVLYIVLRDLLNKLENIQLVTKTIRSILD